MRRERITVTLKGDLITNLDSLVDGKTVKNRSNAIEHLIENRFKLNVLRKAILVGSSHGIHVSGQEMAKILLPIGGRTLIERNISALKKVGVEEIFIVTDKWKKDIEQVIGGGEKYGVEIKYVEKNDGTAGILHHLKKEINGNYLMANNDILLETIDLADMHEFHIKNKATATVAVTAVPDPSRLGSIFMKGEMITDFKEKAEKKSEQSHLINAGVYIMEPTVADMPKKGFSMVERDVFPDLAQKNKLFGYQIGDDWTHLHDEKLYNDYLTKIKKTGVK